MKIKKKMQSVPAIFSGVLLAVAVACQSGPDDHQLKKAHDQSVQDEHAEHAELSEHGGEQIVHITSEEMESFGIEVATAGPGKLKIQISLPGEVLADPSRVAHIVPQVRGVTRKVWKEIGERVSKGEIMAVLESRELSELKSTFLVAKERVSLAESTFQREERLWKQSVSSEREYLEAKQALAKARIEKKAADQQLNALGFSEEYLENLSFHQGEPFARYEISSPFDGMVIEKHITLGEALQEDSEIFTIANLSSVWVNLTVYQKDLPYIHVDQPVTIDSKHGNLSTSSAISYISPILFEETRTASARVVLDNSQGQWRPGLFVTARVTVEETDVPIIVQKTALLTLENETAVFVRAGNNFELKPVELGRGNGTHVEIISGIEPGRQYVISGAFTLKSELDKASFGGEGHSH